MTDAWAAIVGPGSAGVHPAPGAGEGRGAALVAEVCRLEAGAPRGGVS